MLKVYKRPSHTDKGNWTFLLAEISVVNHAGNLKNLRWKNLSRHQAIVTDELARWQQVAGNSSTFLIEGRRKHGEIWDFVWVTGGHKWPTQGTLLEKSSELEPIIGCNQLHPIFGSEWLLFMDECSMFIHKIKEPLRTKKEPLRTKYWMQLGYNQLLVPAQKIFLTVYTFPEWPTNVDLTL